jgi:hypothetical protein
MSDIIDRLRDPMVDVSYSDRLEAADEIERLRKVSHDAGSSADQLAKARLKIE